MKFRFLGGANEIGRVGLLAEIATGQGTRRLLFDYGMTPSNPPLFPAESPPIDYVFLTHAHVDHSGMIPWLCSRYNISVFATTMTSVLSEILAVDASKIAGIEGFPFAYTNADIVATRSCYEPIRYGTSTELDDIVIKFHSAGHIPGSTMFELELIDGRTLLFTGDINPKATRLLPGNKPVRCDILFIESTYASRNHELRQKIEYEFLGKLEDVIGRGGVAIVPAFGVERTQELLMVLNDTNYQVWLDGMGKRVTKHILGMTEYIKDQHKLRKAFNKVRFVHTEFDRRRACNSGEVILTTSGMLDGGPVLYYINALKNDAKNCILLTGYQVEGTNGRQLLDTHTLNLYGVNQRVDCEVAFFDFSAHAGHRELVEFIRRCNPTTVVLFHGDKREAIVEELGGDEYKFILPDSGVEFEV